MSLRAPLFYQIPEQTIQVARAAFPKGNPYMRMRDALGPIYTNPDFAHLFPKEGQPAEAPAHLALVTIMQFAEGLSDAQAADAVRGRIDWKYALALELTDPGFDSSVLSEFRSRLIAGQAELLLFEQMLTLFRERKLLKARGRQRTDSTHVLAAIQVLNRLECVGEALRQALNRVAALAPDWLQRWVPAEWFDRYSHRFEEYRLPPGKAERYALAEHIGADGRQFLLALYDPTAPSHLRALPAVETLRRVWLQQFYAAPADEPMRWRAADDLPPGPLLISSPYDPDARYSKKRHTEWVGYKVHLTETCDEDTPNLITDVTTTPATTLDFPVLATIQQNLAERAVLPSEQLVDAGYMAADQFQASRTDHQIDLVGPIAENRSWQTRQEDGLGAAQFIIDWEAKQATCPQGKTSVGWYERQSRHGRELIQIRFAKEDCAACSVRSCCTEATTQGRSIQVRSPEHVASLQEARERQRQDEFAQRYARRAGVEGTIAQGVSRSDLRRSRYRGFAKTRLLHILIGAALNFVRVAAWLAEVPRSQTYCSPFAALAPTSG
ncbi:MAG TPA: IS1182 family transposase [Alphaproteobacteria bacterium]|nr:IS1182 family transposase [Alphaproteobacteria bacterium]